MSGTARRLRSVRVSWDSPEVLQVLGVRVGAKVLVLKVLKVLKVRTVSTRSTRTCSTYPHR
jgi:hypothetical protein